VQIRHRPSQDIDNTDVMEAHQREYLRAVHRRVRRADTAVISRIAAVQLAWIVALLCGAGVTLVQAFGTTTVDWLDQGDVDWISALLGFLVVVAQGAGRLVGRTSGVVQADDTMRRNVAREERLFHAGAGPYRGASDPFELFAERAEAELLEHDRHVARYSAAVLQNGD
jgi:hypothetical protein